MKRCVFFVSVKLLCTDLVGLAAALTRDWLGMPPNQMTASSQRLTVDLSLVGQFGVQEWVTQDTLCYKPQTKLIRLPRTGGTSQ